MQTFQPVLLGSDANVYGMARSFYAQYGVVSDAICKAVLVACRNTKLVRIAAVEPQLEDDETFVRTLVAYAESHDYARRLCRRLHDPDGPPPRGAGPLLPFCLPGAANRAGS